jgi:hypothetical protein
MLTNSPRQQATRHMTAAQKDAAIAADIAADTQARREHERTFQATRELWNAAYAAGLDVASLHALDMALMRGSDPADLRKMIDIYPTT